MTPRAISRIAIVNRGEAAIRLIHAVRDLNARTCAGERPMTTIALFTDAERHAMFVREADEAHGLGPAANRPYLDLAVLERALAETAADAVWVGWGFVAEDPAFAELCRRVGVSFIGPSPAAMRKLGDKIGAKLIAERAGLPVAPWSHGSVDTLEDALDQARGVGYPLMLKASAGGGGRGIRLIRSADELREAYVRTREEAQRAFGSGVLFLEQLLTGARHVEVQILADGQGTAWAVGVRDCSLQRRNQKVIEESASPVLAGGQVRELKEAAERLALAVDYEGAGTVEFLYQPGQHRFAFLEVNTRLQVEHPVTEVTTGIDLVQAQIHIAGGGRLDGPRPAEVGHAIEARLNAEDPDRDFAPAPGRISLLRLPAGPGTRVDTGMGEGDEIPADFDSMIAKIIAYGRDRNEAIARLRRAVGETAVVIDGGTTNKTFLLDLLAQPEFLDGTADTGWIDRARAEGRLVSHEHSGVALVAAGIEAYEAEELLERTRLFETSRGGRPQAQHEAGRPLELELRGTTYKVTVLQTGPRRFRVGVLAPDGRTARVDAELERLDAHTARISVGARTHRLLTAGHGPLRLVEIDGVAHRVSRDEGGVLRAPSPAFVVAVPAPPGSEVAAGEPVVVLESMKMEAVITAPLAATVKQVFVSAGSQVETGAPLVRLEPTGAGSEPTTAVPACAGADLDLPDASVTPTADPRDRAARCRAELTALLLGYDVDPDDDGHLLQSYLQVRDELAAAGTPCVADEVDMLAVFADIAELGRNRPVDEQEHTEHTVHSPREHFHSYLQSLDADRGELPDSFRDRLSRVLRHYGIAGGISGDVNGHANGGANGGVTGSTTGLDRTPELEDAVFRVFLAQQRSTLDVALATSILQRWVAEPCPPDGTARLAREVLDRLVLATQRRIPVVGDLARSARFRWFDQPLVDAERASVLADARRQVQHLAADPEGADRAARIDALAAIPEPIVGFLFDRLRDGVPDYEPMLEVLIRRHYREHALDARPRSVDGRPFAVADYVLDGQAVRLVSTVGLVSELTPNGGLIGAVQAQVADRGVGQQAVVDLYLGWPDAPDDADGTAAQLVEMLAPLAADPGLRRVAVAVGPRGDRPVRYYTFHRDDGSIDARIVEDRLVRDMHPMVGRRLNLWRLREFDVVRLQAPADVLLYRCTARGNPADRRLVAMAQVRQLVVVRGDDGTVTSLPHVERAVANCIEAIRRERAAEGGHLDGNLVWVQLWPVVEAPLEQLTALQSKIVPLSVDAGIDEVVVQGRVATGDGAAAPVVARFHSQPGSGVGASIEPPPTEPLHPLDDYAEKVQRARRRGLLYPYELQALIAGRGGTSTEYDLEDGDRLAPVDRPYGLNTAGIIVGVVSTPTAVCPEGVTRLIMCGDPTRALGAVSEAECRRIVAALDLAEQMKVPIEWFAVSAGARIAMDSGTENMDWVARALKRIVQFTQSGGEINIVVAGINVGAQPYWNAEATMLMHTKGILVMTPDSAMVLTGKQTLDFAGGVSAEDNFGIGGYDRVMGPNGQAQYWAPDLTGARDILMAHYAHSYVVPGEQRPRRAATTDPVDRDITPYPHSAPGTEFTTVGDIFSARTNRDRKKPFDIRTLMRSVSDQDHQPLERWAGMADAETAVVQDVHLGGLPATLIGIESKSVPRRGYPPSDGPDTYTAGTLFPRSSKKVARAINAASGNRPVVVLANLSGFDGSPDSMRHLQLEYGAEIGRAVVNFDGPIVFVVVSRYHGGAFVVFSKALNPQMTVLAVEGSFASVIGGAPAAAVVFARDVDARTADDRRVRQLDGEVNRAQGAKRAQLATELAELRTTVRAEKIGEVATEFDAVHSIQRAVGVGSVDEIIAAADLRPRIVAALEADHCVD